MTELLRVNSIYCFAILQPAVPHSNAITSYPVAISDSPIMTTVDEVNPSG